MSGEQIKVIIIQNLSANFPGKNLKEGRSECLHLSQIYSDLEKELYPKNVVYLPTNSSNLYYAEVGFLFEEALTLAFRDRLGIRPGEIELNGVIGSPDGVNWADWYLEEYKCTWRSIKTTPDQVWKWMTQVQGYCKMLDMTKVLFRVLYVMGDYKHSGPIYREFWLEFSQEEIDRNWAMLINHAVRKGWLPKNG